MDGLAWVFALLICGIGALVVLYAAYYLDPATLRAILRYLLLFMARCWARARGQPAAAGVFWEATSLSSFLLIGYWNHPRTRVRAPAWR